MPELPPGYRVVSAEDRKKAQAFFAHGTSLAGSGQFDYAISMFLDGLRLDPDDVDAHQKLRETSLKRKASGGKGLGMLEAMKLKKATKDDKENLLNAEKLLAHDPGNGDHMLAIAQNAARAGYYDTVLWIGQVLMQAESENARPNLNRWLGLKDVYKKIEQYEKAAMAGEYAMRLKPNDMELTTEIKGLRAQQTMRGAGYDKMGGFRGQVKDMEGQLRLMRQDMNTTDADATSELIAAAEKELAADPNEPGKLSKLVTELVRSEKVENENRAVKLLQEWYDKTKQFRFRKTMSEILMKQGVRKDRAMAKAIAHVVDPDERKEKEKEHVEAKRKQLEFELSEYELWQQAYPTDLAIRYEMGRRQFQLRKFDDAIANLQTARNDPSHRMEASIYLGRSFKEAGYLEEAEDTLGTIVKDHALREGDKFKQSVYWYGRVLEDRNKVEEAKKTYSQLFQLDSGYLDVSARLKKLRQPPPGGQA